jgi:hypothetical protein
MSAEGWVERYSAQLISNGPADKWPLCPLLQGLPLLLPGVGAAGHAQEAAAAWHGMAGCAQQLAAKDQLLSQQVGDWHMHACVRACLHACMH